MDKTYSPQSIEQACYERWESHHYFEPHGHGKSYSIMLPPPNVTGSLHMGHGLQQTLMDALTRYHRMRGYKTLWQPGTDHAGISTQLVVEGKLAEEGLSRKDFTREDFIKRIWDWKNESGNQIKKQMRRLGVSVAWSRERFTLDEGLSAAVHKVFVQLYEEGLIYRGSRLVNWDPKLSSAISDLEVISEEEDGFLWHIRYPLAEGGGSLVIATTRPETLLGDTAVAVHPEDPRYQDLIGKEILLPLCGRYIPIIGDEAVDPSFGTGCVKVTPAHDFNDYEMGKRHHLPFINIFTKKGRINKNAPLAYQGMDRFVAREKILEELQAEELLIKAEPYKLKIPRGEKTGAIIEPLLTDQWYIKIKPLAEPALEAVNNGEIRFVPAHWTNTYNRWMENLEDWCISRQLWWGHRIPAWYDNQGNIYVGYSEKDVRFKYHLDSQLALTQDEDVLDTWFSSALWPFSSLGWPEHTPELETFYPSTVLVTGFDIIFFWVARMIMMGLKFTKQIPFHEIYITGLIRDAEGQKMSKSKGNVLDPLDVIDGIGLDELIKKRTSNLLLASAKQKISKDTQTSFPAGIPAFGVDALRFTFCSLAATGQNIRFDLERVQGYRNFCNKLWNASRFVILNSNEDQVDLEDGAFQYSPADRWILSRLQAVISLSHHYFEIYRFDLLASTLYDFVWHEYCDWYLEFSKQVLYNDQALGSMKRGTRQTIIQVLDQVLKLLHPIIPFITEEIWQRVNKLTSQNEESIMCSPYPQVDSSYIDLSLEEEFTWIKTLVQALRAVRSELNVSPAKMIPLYVKNLSPSTQKRLKTYLPLLEPLVKISKLIELKTSDKIPPSASAIVGEMELFIPLEGLIDQASERLRLEKELEKLEKTIELALNKLNRTEFIQNAPNEVIEKEKEKLLQAEQAKRKLLLHKEMIERLGESNP